jgi:hypothetical protein
MNPSKKGWLAHLLDVQLLKELNLPGDEKLPKEKQVYHLLQPTGLMYGHPTNVPGVSLLNSYDDTEKSKVIFTQGLFRVFQLFYIDKPHRYDDTKGFCVELIQFYYEIYPTIFKKPKELTNLDLESLMVEAEYVIEKRVEVGYSNYDAFWSSFFQNSLLYLDVILFSLYNGSHDQKHISQLKNDACSVVLQIIALSAGADDVIEQEERRLFKYFFNSASMEGNYKETLNEMLSNKSGFDMVDFKLIKPYWIFRKYLLEVAILTIFSDKDVHEKERKFLKVLSEKLHLSEDEVDTSFVAIETYVLENTDHIHYLKKDKMISVVMKKLMRSMTKVLGRNMSKIKNEITESKELMQLLTDSNNRTLSESEKEAVRVQLVDVLKCLPIFIIIALPGTFLTLPILLKILPDSAFPTSFHENKRKLTA